jgi:electron transport complex protein RnfG
MSEPVELTVSVGQRQPGSARLIATLGVAGMLSGLTLAGVYELTGPMIAENKQERLRRGVFEVVPGSSQMQMLVSRDGALVAVGESEAQGEPAIYAAYDDQSGLLGYALVGEGAGFQDNIRVLFGFDPVTNRVIGMRILQSRETPGLGDKIYKDLEFVSTFESLSIDPEIVVVNDGRDADNEVDAITGATISSKAVVRIINDTNQQWLPLLPPLGAEPPRPPSPDETNTGAEDQSGGAP